MIKSSFLSVCISKKQSQLLYVNTKSNLPGTKPTAQYNLPALLASGPGTCRHCVIQPWLWLWSADPSEGFHVFRLHFFVFFLLCCQHLLISSVYSVVSVGI